MLFSTIDESMWPYHGHTGTNTVFDPKLGLGQSVVSELLSCSVVNMLSNFEDIHPVSTAERYSQKEKKIVKISCPKLVVSYNSHMEKVNLFDRFMSNFRIEVEGKMVVAIFFYLH
jgi:hypothetical protein